MINHELALELKNAGFPQKQRSIIVGNEDYFVPDPNKLDVYYYMPALEELIEACGEINLAVGDKVSLATHLKILGVKGVGSTPKEAVTRLYLALKKK